MTKGNARSSGYERNEDDWYVESFQAVAVLFQQQSFKGTIHDPACGGGNIPFVAQSFGYEASGADIADRGYGPVRDFLSDDATYDNIVTNPPFNIAEQFVTHGLAHVRDMGRVCVLQRLALAGGYGSLGTIVLQEISAVCILCVFDADQYVAWW